MKSGNVISAIQNLCRAKEHFQDFQREYPNSIGSIVFNKYLNKIDWIFKDILSATFITQEVRDGIREEIKSDAFIVPAIYEKIAILNPSQRELIEETIDAMLEGQDVKIFDTNEG